MTSKVLWPPATSKYGGLWPRIWVSVTSKMFLPLTTTNCGGLWPQKFKVITVGYPKNGQGREPVAPDYVFEKIFLKFGMFQDRGTFNHYITLFFTKTNNTPSPVTHWNKEPYTL